MTNFTTRNLSQCYKVLNVSPSMKWETVKKSYHSLAKQYHPDLNPSNSAFEEKIKEITRAFKTLETHYKEQQIEEQFNKLSFPGNKIRRPPISIDKKIPEKKEPVEPDEDFPDPPAAAGSQDENRSWRQRFSGLQKILLKLEKKLFLLDVRKSLRVDPATAVHGGTIRMHSRKESFLVKIPSGSWTRMELRIPEKGESSLFGKKRGDLLLNIQVVRSDQINPGDLMFYYEISIPKEKLMKARVVTLDSVHGPIKFILPRNTRNGQNFILKSKPKHNTSSSSSHVVTVRLI